MSIAHLSPSLPIERELGRGSMGRVLLVREGRSAGDVPSRPLACKLLETPALRDDFVREYRLLSALSHPAFVRPHRLLAVATDKGPTLAALLELVDGAPLTPVARPDLAIPLAFQLLSALDHLHRAGLVHGDLAPPNVLWREAPLTLKVLDLGAAGPPGSRPDSLTGILAYAAPERLAGAPLDPSADLWSAGALLFGLVHGRHPIPGYPAREPRPDRAGCTAHPLDPWLDRLLAEAPADRPPSATSALAELEALTGQLCPPPALHDAPLPLHPGPLHDRATAALDRVPRALTVLDLQGPAGSGRTRMLAALSDAWALRDTPVVLLPATELADRASAWLLNALAALGAPPAHDASDDDLLDRLLRALHHRRVALGIDDLDRAPNVRAVVTRLVRAVSASPDHHRELTLITVGLGPVTRGLAPLELTPWTADDLAGLLARRFPGRTLRRPDLEALHSLSRGQIGLLALILAEALRAGLVTLSPTSVLIDVARLETLAPPTLEAAVAADLAHLPAPLRDEVGLFAHSPLPLQASPELVASGLVVTVRGGHLLTSEALTRAARTLLPPATAHAQLATRHRAEGRTLAATLHDLLAAPDDPARIEAALNALHTPDSEETRLARALVAASHLETEAHDPLDTADDRPALMALLEVLESRPDWPPTAAAALAAARIHERSGHADRARHNLELATVLAPTAPLQALATVALARFELDHGRFAAAIEAHARALDILADHGPPELVFAMCVGKARAEAMSGKLDEARATLDQTRDLTPPPPPLILARHAYVEGLIHWYRGELDAAGPRLAAAAAACREAESPSDEAAVITAQGLIAHRRGDLDRASACYLEALHLGERVRDLPRVLSALQNLGVVRHERGDLTEALDTYQQALAMAEALDARARIAQIAGNLGNLFRYLGAAEDAERVLERGLELARADENRHLTCLLLNLLGDLASDRLALPSAEALYREAIALAEQHGHRPEALEAGLNLVRVLLERGDLGEASSRLAAILSIFETSSQTHAPLEAHHVTALALDAALRRQRAEDPTPPLTRALTALEAVKNPDHRWPILHEAALAARDRGDLGEAERWASEARRVLQSLLDRVPGPYRQRFSDRRDRRAALRDLTPMLTPPKRPNDSDHPLGPLGWVRLLELHKRLAAERSVERLLEYIMDSAILLSGAERGFLLLGDGTPDDLEVRIARNLDQENLRNRHLKLSRGIAQRVIATGEPVVTVDAMEDERYRDQLSVVDQRLRSIVCLPMSLRGRVLGAIYLDNRFRSAAFSPDDLRFMSAFADMAAIALDNARLLESLEQQRAENDRARREIESLNERLAVELEHRTRELEDTKVAILHERRQAASVQGLEHIIGEAPSLRRVFQMIERLRATDIPVLVQGESGTGKELIARALHFSGARKERPFVAVNCGAIPANLLESELFGHVRGAFTGAHQDKRGLFEVAHTGTLFLDEIGEMPLEMQVKLLRVLQSGEIQKVGASRELRVDARIVAATNRRLEDEVRAGRFREDLYYRLSVVTLPLPPLRERAEDIPLLVAHFLAQNRKSGLGAVTGISRDALAALQRYPFPGNIRQLETVLKNASVFADGDTLTLQDLQAFPEIVSAASHATSANRRQTPSSLAGRPLADIERDAIIDTLKQHQGNKKKTAELLGIDRRTLYNKLAAYGIEVGSDIKLK